MFTNNKKSISEQKGQKIPEKIVQEYLTKSAFLKGIECPRKLKYYQDDRYHIEELAYKEYVRIMGILVGDLAKNYYPNGIDLTDVNQNEAIIKTQEFLKEENIIIYEAAFIFNNLLVRADICKKKGNDIYIIEVKSKLFNPTKDSFLTIKNKIRSSREKNILDITFQKYVAQKAFPQFNFKTFIMYINKSQSIDTENIYSSFQFQISTNNEFKIRSIGNKDDLHKIATQTLIELPVSEIVDEILSNSKNVLSIIDSFDRNLIELIDDFSILATTKKYYKAKIGRKCKKCEYRTKILPDNSDKLNGYQECWSEALGWTEKEFSAPHIFDIWYEKLDSLMANNIYLMKDIDIDQTFKKKDNSGRLNFLNNKAERQILQIKKAIDQSMHAEYVFSDLKILIETLNYPLYLIDFETAELAIPNSINRKPNDIIAFQFSVHKMLKNGKVEHHAEWIMTKSGKFPNYDFVRALKEALDSKTGSIIHYHKHERKVLNEISKQLQEEKDDNEDAEELLEWLKKILDRPSGAKELSLVDMYEFVIKGYYHRDMEGSNSIKSVLPAILSSSKYLKEKYSLKYYSENYSEGIIWYQEKENKNVRNPYDILMDKGKNNQDIANLLEINVGSSAAKAYTFLQFSGISDTDRKKIESELLRYCELDTLAMVMILEHWLSIFKS